MCCQGNAARVSSEIVLSCTSGMAMDLTLDLKSLQFENGLSEEEKECVILRSRSSGLAVCGCAHALFLCRLMSLVR